ncbi:putative AAA domain-containing protein C31G5.19 [Fusarium oxysporum f. sp. albedinis]|nr:putative AAA domain-containing protein C31G5.19 [Fusarium oxysporum f. sp. albedinis]
MGALAGRAKDRNTNDTPKRPFRCQSNPHCSSAAFPELSQGSQPLALSAKSGISACRPLVIREVRPC